MSHERPESDDRPLGAVDARFTLAAERTMLSWLRTALGFIAAGVAVLHVVDPFGSRGTRTAMGITLLAVGALVALTGTWRWRQTDRALRDGGSMPGPLAVYLLTAALAIVAILFIAFA